jgi:hypothetical protein
VIDVYLPVSGGFITGGGYTVVTSSAGTYPGDPNSHNNFGFNVKYNKSNTNLQGNINTIIQSGGRLYQVKGNSMTSLTTATGTTCGGVSCSTATFTGKASIQDVTNPNSPVPVDGNASLQVTMTDFGTNTKGTIGITVYGKSGAMWFSNNWVNNKTVEKSLGGGNLSVK